jgi:hypothetical protein
LRHRPKDAPPTDGAGAAHLCREVQWVALRRDSRDHPIALCDWLQTSTQPGCGATFTALRAPESSECVAVIEKWSLSTGDLEKETWHELFCRTNS